MAKGRVITGYSDPYVAIYTAGTAGAVSYSSGQALARGVSVNIDVETTEDNRFYADNIVAENEAGKFKNGTLTATVDGLKDTANDLILGLTASTDYTDYDDDQKIPYVGFGCVVRYMEDGEESYMAVVLPKVMFNEPTMDAETQEDEIDWQTQELTAQIFRDDTEKHKWKRRFTAKSTQALAVADITGFFSA